LGQYWQPKARKRVLKPDFVLHAIPPTRPLTLDGPTNPPHRAMKHTLLLFDVDGTLLTTHGAGQRAMATAGQRLFGEQFTFDRVRFAGGLDPLLFAEAARTSDMLHAIDQEQAFREAYVTELEAEIARAGDTHPMPGITPLLDTLRQRMAQDDGVMLGLLTGNYPDAAPIKLAAAGLDVAWFPITAFGSEGPTRPDLPPLAMHRYHQRTGVTANPRRVVVIGDTPRDVDCANTHGCVSFAVATGRSSVRELQQAGAEIAVEDLSDPTPLLDLLD
jgi:phosphoglycolate phosphatase-like HAD superfamily hydrolase